MSFAHFTPTHPLSPLSLRCTSPGTHRLNTTLTLTLTLGTHRSPTPLKARRQSSIIAWRSGELNPTSTPCWQSVTTVRATNTDFTSGGDMVLERAMPMCVVDARRGGGGGGGGGEY